MSLGEEELANNRRGLQLFTTSKGTSSQVSSTFKSPVKTRPKLATEEDIHTEVSPSQLRLNRDTEIHNPISVFPTLSQPVMDTKLKNMLLSFQRSIHSDIEFTVHHFKAEKRDLGRDGREVRVKHKFD